MYLQNTCPIIWMNLLLDLTEKLPNIRESCSTVLFNKPFN